MATSAASHSDFRALRKFPHLDGLRAFCILPVIFHHTASALAFGKLSERGFLGVDMFFVISGFLIVTLLLREQDREGQVSLFNFYVRRTLRIMPLYFGVVALCVVIYGLGSPSSPSAHAFFAELPYYLTYTTNWFPVTTLLTISWSLSAEEQFYLIWPPLQKLVRFPVAVLLVLVAISQIIQFRLADALLAKLGVGPNALPMLRQTTFTPILFGVLLAYALHSETWFRRIAALVGHRAAPLAISALLLAGLLFFPSDLSGWPRLTIHILLALFLASIVVRTDHALAPVLSWKPIVRIGVLSYGMYLWHVFAIEACTRALPRLHLSNAWLFPATAALTYVIAELSYRYYESFFLRRKAQFQRPRTANARDSIPARA
jgi:peptidoglycan/LPS O-acetylase OafA/YrhL